MNVTRRQFLGAGAAAGVAAATGIIGAPAIAQARTKVKVGYLHTLAVDGQIWLGLDSGSFASTTSSSTSCSSRPASSSSRR
jgi:NitT/TauT family transport system substrate-binding protein